MRIRKLEAVKKIIRHSPMPEKYTKAFHEAFEHYPDLFGVRIKLKLKKMDYTMQAWPERKFPLKPKRSRVYIIFINSSKGRWSNAGISRMPHKELVGMFAHELAHILDYNHRSSASMLKFSSLYVSSSSFRKKVERKTDLVAIQHGLGEELHASRKFLLEEYKISKNVQERLVNFYLSLHEIELFLSSRR